MPKRSHRSVKLPRGSCLTAAMKSSRWSTMQVSFHGTGRSPSPPSQPHGRPARHSPRPPQLSGEDPVYFVKEGPGLYRSCLDPARVHVGTRLETHCSEKPLDEDDIAPRAV